MEVNGGPANPSVIAEVSFSFQDELTSTLQNALGVAVEIAVAEITRLLDRALRDVQGKIQEALRDNSVLKFRLKRAETQLSTVRGRLEQQPHRLEDFPIGCSNQLVGCSKVQRRDRQLNNVTLNVGQPTESTVDSEHDYEVCGSKETNIFQRGSICGNSNGGALAQTINSDSLEESTHYRLDETNDIKNDQHNMNKTDQACAGTVTSEGSFLEVAVKVEKEESYDDPIPVSLSVVEEPNSDSLSLAQSRLLEDWRPEPLYSESCQSNMHCQSTNQHLDLDFLSSSSSGQHTLFPKHHNNHYKIPGHHAFPPGRSPYHCSLCGRDFNRKHHLKIHQRIHTGERPYTCSICSARFRHALTLKRHFRLHTGEKPYVCGQCGKKFRNDGGLKVHQCS
ncbi:zinc finger protein 502 [Pseudorasbora parva]|uniref:zinc finger protein 502 n=1 Tax=Pseudorasbora parva TaxID=51549 RepID=UPI00351DBAFE